MRGDVVISQEVGGVLVAELFGDNNFHDKQTLRTKDGKIRKIKGPLGEALGPLTTDLEAAQKFRPKIQWEKFNFQTVDDLIQVREKGAKKWVNLQLRGDPEKPFTRFEPRMKKLLGPTTTEYEFSQKEKENEIEKLKKEKLEQQKNALVLLTEERNRSDNLTDAFTEKQDKIQQQEEKINDLERQLKLRPANEEKESKQKELEEAKKKLEIMNKEYKSLQEQNKIANERIKNLEEQEKRVDIPQYMKDLIEEEKEKEIKMKKDLSLANERIKVLEVQEKRDDISKLQKEKLEVEISKLTNSRKELVRKLSELSDKNKKLKEEMINLEVNQIQEFNAQNEELIELEEELKNRNERIEEKDEEITKLQTKLASASSDEEKEILEGKIQTLVGSLKELQSDRVQKDSEIQKLKQQFEETEAEIHKSANIINDKELEIQKLKQQLKNPNMTAEERTVVEATIKKYIKVIDLNSSHLKFLDEKHKVENSISGKRKSKT